MANETDIKREDAAAEWHARLHDASATGSDWAAFTDWLEADPANQTAYEAVAEAARTAEVHGDAILEALAAHTQAADAMDTTSATVIDARWRWRKPLMNTVMAIAAMLMVAVGLNFFGASDPVTQSYTTAMNENREVTLADGTVLTLNRDTSVSVTFDDDARRATLSHGEALFHVAKDKEHPFFVRSGAQEIRVVGTVFNVQNYDGTITVSVAEGIVDVKPADVAQQPVRLTAGRELVQAEGAGKPTVRSINAANVGTWQDGFLVFDGDTLNGVATSLNRYFAKPIMVTPEAGSLPFSGILKMDNQQAVLAVLAESLPIEIIEDSDTITLRMKQQD